MKCLNDCGWDHKPESLNLLVQHVEACAVCIPKDVKVVWKDSEFFVVETPEEEDTVLSVEFRKFDPAPTVEPIVIKQPIEALGYVETVPTVEVVVEEAVPEE